MTPEILALLCDPETKAPLTLVDSVREGDGRIESGVLVTPGGRSYPIRNGIPRFVSSTELTETVRSFGDEWNEFNFTDFKANWVNHAIRNTFGSTAAIEGRLIVDAGGGSGAQTLWMLEAGAKHVIMLELSHSVDDVVQRNLARSPYKNYDVIQCSIDAPPFRPHSINGIVICHNVIQHTESVERTARALFEITAEGGEFVFNCYASNDQGIARWLRRRLVYAPLRALLSRAPFGIRLWYARAMALLRFVPLIGMVLEKAGLCSRGDVSHLQFASTRERLRLEYKATVLNTFDRFGAHRYQHLKSDDELQTLVSELQPDSSKVSNKESYFRRPQPIGCAIRIRR